MKANGKKLGCSAARVLVAAGIIALGAGCSSTGKLAKAQAGYTRERVDARGLFVENCARCHSEDGRAKTFRGRVTGAQNLADTKWRSGTSPEGIIHAIKTGPKMMPAFQNKLSEAEIEAVAAYVQTFTAD